MCQSLQLRNNCCGTDNDIFEPQNTSFGFHGTPEWCCGAFQLIFTTEYR